MHAVIAEDQRASEVLVCIVQFSAVAFFGAFYALTPKAFPAEVPFEPVPWALGSYALFTGARLWLALTGRLNKLVLHVSVVVDVAVLMLTIWSFHLQYQQPATVYLKAPTLLYVFILIALRAMRFEAAYVLLAGAAAIVGWSVLVGYAVLTAGEMQITRNFAEYATSGAILIGAEVDKIVSIAAVTVILAAAIVRARRLLVRAATESHAASQLSRFFAPEVASEIRGADAGFAPGDAVVREAAVLVIDLRGFTALAARLAPTETVRLLRDYHREVVPAVQQHGGMIDKYLGDGIMTTFGAARPSASHAADAFRAAESVLFAAASWNASRAELGEQPVEINAAIAVGPVLFGVTGEASRLEFTVIGDAVNLAAKLEKHCKTAGRVALSTAAAWERACTQGLTTGEKWESLPAEVVPGMDGQLDLVGWCGNVRSAPASHAREARPPEEPSSARAVSVAAKGTAMAEGLLAGKTALVTGASSGIGSACAVALGEAGADVVVNFHSDEDGARETAGKVEAAGGNASICRADVGDEDDVLALFAHTRERFGILDILVNNAGIQKDADLIEMSLDDWQAVMRTNLQGQFLCAREAAREFCRRREDRAGAGAIGNIIFMSSVHDRIPWAGHANYTAAKGGVLMLMKTMAQELGHEKIRVNAVCPGAIRTDINREAWESDKGRHDILGKVPYGRIGEPVDVARAVLWLASDDSEYVHGHALYIDGGMSLYPEFREGG